MGLMLEFAVSLGGAKKSILPRRDPADMHDRNVRMSAFLIYFVCAWYLVQNTLTSLLKSKPPCSNGPKTAGGIRLPTSNMISNSCNISRYL